MQIDIPFIFTALTEIFKALPLTMIITLVPLMIGFLIGIGITLIRIRKVKGIYRLANFYVSFLRGTPALMHIMLIYLGLPLLIDKMAETFHWSIQSTSIPILLFVLMALSLTAGAYMSEIIRAGILAVDQGQLEAAESIGMTGFQAMRRIVFPQAIAISLPNLCNIFIGFLHTSSIAFIVSQKELTGAANIVASNNLKFLEAYIAAALIYWGLTIISEKVTALLEKRVTVYNRGGVA